MERGRKFKGAAERQDQGCLGHLSHMYLKHNIASRTEHLPPMPLTLFNPWLRYILFVKELFNYLFYTSGDQRNPSILVLLRFSSLIKVRFVLFPSSKGQALNTLKRDKTRKNPTVFPHMMNRLTIHKQRQRRQAFKNYLSPLFREVSQGQCCSNPELDAPERLHCCPESHTSCSGTGTPAEVTGGHWWELKVCHSRTPHPFMCHLLSHRLADLQMGLCCTQSHMVSKHRADELKTFLIQNNGTFN